MKKKSLIAFIILFVIFLFQHAYRTMEKNNVYNDVMEDPVRDTAVVKRIFSDNGNIYFEYQYDVYGAKFQGRGEREFGVFQDVKIGDSIIIAFKSSAPEKSVPTNIFQFN